ncbi:hypothetical protein [Cumulibacter soli]|uniref:hypothetical protein n=1 Tax=Cumulibacter soli TaxID=2546344 RepID=UPI00141A58E6|nr:hypothetical protein [Cumulibacter soli]
MHATTLIGSRLAQLGYADEIRQLECARGPLVARRRGIELLMSTERRTVPERTIALTR